jgi:predicted TIM-barrel fold metal-dependent hydrolase
MDQEGIDVSVLFPTSAFGITQSPEKAYAAAFCRGYNDWIANLCKESPRLKGIGLVPFQDVPSAVAEINRAVTKLGLVGIAIASYGMKDHLGTPTLWPIYEELQRLKTPLLVHNSRQGPAGEIRFDTFLFQHTVARPFETMIDCAALLYGGIPEKFPKLRIAFLECGCGWVPYWMDRMDEEWEHRQSEAPLLKAKPSEYITHGNWFFAAEPEESTVPYVMDRIGDDKIIFASDYPHWDGMFPYVVSTIRERKDISQESKHKFLGENARRLYGWD